MAASDSCRDGWNVRNCSSSHVQVFRDRWNVQIGDGWNVRNCLNMNFLKLVKIWIWILQNLRCLSCKSTNICISGKTHVDVNNDINVDFTSNTKFMLLQLRECKFCSIQTTQAIQYIQTLQEIGRFHTFHPSQILFISLAPKNLYLACWAISYISSIPTWIRYLNGELFNINKQVWLFIHQTICVSKITR